MKNKASIMRRIMPDLRDKTSSSKRTPALLTGQDDTHLDVSVGPHFNHPLYRLESEREMTSVCCPAGRLNEVGV
ncbi:MAG: hypothetical protein WB763_06480 [Terriglobia bacterium]